MLAGYTGLFACFGVFCLSFVQPATATAKPAAFLVALEYEAAPSCPGAEQLQGAVVARLGYDPFASGAPNHVLVRIAPKANSLDGRIEWRDADGQWAGDQSFSMASGDCVRLTRTMALALAVQIQLLHGDLQTTATVEPDQASATESADKPSGAKPVEQSTPPTSGLEPPAATHVERDPRPGAPAVFSLGAGPAIAFGMAPYPIALGRLVGQLAWQRASVQLAAEASLPTTFRRVDGAGVSEQVLLLSLAGCEAFGRWNACLVVDAGTVALAGRDIDNSSSTHLPLLDAGLRAGFNQPLGQRAFINAHADGLVVLTRWTASLDSIPVWTTPSFAAVAGIDIGVQLR